MRPPRRLVQVFLIDDPEAFEEQAAWLDDLLGPAGELMPAAGFADAARVTAAGSGDAPAPDLVLFEPLAAGCDDLSALDSLRAALPETRFAALSRRCTAFEVNRLMRVGLRGYLPKGAGPEVLRAAVHLILAGGIYLPPCMVGEGLLNDDGRAGSDVGALRGTVFRRVRHPDGRLTYPYIRTAGRDVCPLDREIRERGAAGAIARAMHPADRTAWAASLEASARHLTPHCAEFRFRDRNGDWRWYRSVSRPFRAADGSVVWDGYSADITREKEEAAPPSAAANQADPAAGTAGRLDDGGRRLEAIIANLPGAAFRGGHGPNGEPTYLYVSPGIVDVAGITPEEMIADPAALYDLLHPEDRAAHLATIRESCRTLQPFNRTFRIITRSGELRWLRSMGQPWRTPGGEIIADGVVIDITHQRETEERLLQRERILDALTGNLPAVVLRCVLGPDGTSRCAFVAGDLESLTGLSAERVVDGSTPLSSRVHPDDRAAYRAAYRRAATALGELDHEFRFLMPDGEVRWLRWIARMRTGPGGGVFADGILLDVTDHRRALEALDRRNRDLLSLCRISEIALNSTSLDAGLRGIIDEIGDRLTGFDTVSVDLYDEDRQLMDFRAYKSFDTGSFAPRQRVPVGETLAGEVIRTGQILIERRCLDRPEARFTRIRELGHQTFFGVPIRVGQRVIGCFGLTAAEDIDVDPKLVELVSSWADYTASFIASQGAEELAALTTGPDRHGGDAFEVAFAARLTPRQRDVLAELAKGRSNKGIAVEFGLQEATVKIHVRAILKALRAANRTQAANIANAVMGGIHHQPRPNGSAS